MDNLTDAFGFAVPDSLTSNLVADTLTLQPAEFGLLRCEPRGNRTPDGSRPIEPKNGARSGRAFVWSVLDAFRFGAVAMAWRLAKLTEVERSALWDVLPDDLIRECIAAQPGELFLALVAKQGQREVRLIRVENLATSLSGQSATIIDAGAICARVRTGLESALAKEAAREAQQEQGPFILPEAEA